jgi:hypothetical protein
MIQFGFTGTWGTVLSTLEKRGPIANRPQVSNLPHKADLVNSSMAMENALACLLTNQLKHIPQCAPPEERYWAR